MDSRVLSKLEYGRIVSRLVEAASTTTGKERAGAIAPSSGLFEIGTALEETTQAKDLRRLYPMFSLGGVHDTRELEKIAAIDGMIDSPDFLTLLDTLRASDRIREFLKQPGLPFPSLVGLSAGLHPLNPLQNEIRAKITDEGTVADRATPELHRLRAKLRSLQGRAREKLESMIRNPEILKYLQDPIISIRGDRYVLPVRAESRSQIPGIVHDISGSGSTVFVEPLSVVEINNETHQCEIEERAEVFRILRELTGRVKAVLPQVEDIRESLTQLDFAMAKGKLSESGDCYCPVINDKGVILLKQARHPLISGKVVPVTVELGKTFDSIIVTGPNTGGKTVLLKTIGLLTLMAQSGLHIPADDGSEIAVFKQVFVDIGDEQSIEQSLSTFSSHMTNIISITRQAGEDSLVLLDELGAGTDPAEGAALGMAIVEDLLRKKAKLVATTHYSELKGFAASHDRVENASVEFDSETLRPTFRLMMGIPGRSNAFEISARLGLDPLIIEGAKAFQSKEEARAANMIKDLETNQIVSERRREEAEAMREQAAGDLARIQQKEEEARRRIALMMEKAREDALELVIKARRESESLLKEIRDMKKAGYKDIDEREARDIRAKLRENEDGLYAKTGAEHVFERRSITELMPGDPVYLTKLKRKAYVLTEANAQGEVTVQAGIIKLTVKKDELAPIEENNLSIDDSYDKKPIPRSGEGSIGAGKAKTIGTELDLRGKMVDEAVTEVEKYLDDAYLAGLPQIYIIHGKGTGALRKAVRDLAANHPFVAGARQGANNEGGDGVTVLTISV